MKYSVPGRIGYSLPEFDIPEMDLTELIPDGYIREQEPELPEVSELDIMRHYTALSTRNHGVDWILSARFLYDEV